MQNIMCESGFGKDALAALSNCHKSVSWSKDKGFLEVQAPMCTCMYFNSYITLHSEHAKEMGSSVPSEPVVFLKPSTAYLQEGNPIQVSNICLFLTYGFSDITHVHYS